MIGVPLHIARKTECFLRNRPETLADQSISVGMINIPQILPRNHLQLTQITTRPPYTMENFDIRRFYEIYNPALPVHEKRLPINSIEAVLLPKGVLPEGAHFDGPSTAWVKETYAISRKITEAHPEVLLEHFNNLVKKTQEVRELVVPFASHFRKIAMENQRYMTYFGNKVADLSRVLCELISHNCANALLELFHRCAINPFVVMLCFDTSMISILGFDHYISFYQALRIDSNMQTLLKHMLYVVGIVSVDYVLPTLKITMSAAVIFALNSYRHLFVWFYRAPLLALLPPIPLTPGELMARAFSEAFERAGRFLKPR